MTEHASTTQPERSSTGETGSSEQQTEAGFGGALTINQRRFLQLQNTVGNQAAQRSLQARVQRINPPTGAAAPTATPTATPAADATGGGNRTYTLRTQIPGMMARDHENVGRDEAMLILRRFRTSLRNSLESERETHQYLIGIHDDQWIVAAVSDTLGGVSLPTISIWEGPTSQLDGSAAALEGTDVMAAYRALQAVAQAIDAARRQVVAYREGTITGAERSITVLEVTEAAGAAAAVVATGGLASTAIAGAGIAATSATGIALSATAASATAGVYGATQATARQTGEIGAGMRQHFDVGAILRLAGTDAVVTFVGAAAGGALTPYIQRLFGSYLTTASPQLLRELGQLNGLAGELPRDFFMTTGQRVLTDFLANAATTPLTAAVSAVMRRLTGEAREMPSPAQFAQMLFDDLIQGGIMGLFFSYASHTMPHSRAPTHSGATDTASPTTTPEPTLGATPAATPEPTRAATPTTTPGPTHPASTTPAVTDPSAAHQSSAPRGGRGTTPEPSVVIGDPEMAAHARPANDAEASQMRATQERLREQHAAQDAQTRQAQTRQLDPPNPSMFERVRERLRGGRWQDVMSQTDGQGPEGLSFGDQMIHYRRSVMAEVARQYQGEPVGTASTERTSDVDINMMGDNAGRNMQAAHDYLVQNVGPQYSRMLRLDLLIDNARSTAYRETMGALSPSEQAMLLGRLNSQTEVLNLARMMQHAEHAAPGPLREQALADARAMQQRLGLSAAEIANVERMAHTPPSETTRNRLLIEIDGLMQQLRTTTDPAARAQLAEQITTKQMEANFHMGEAYIGPGAIRQTVQGRDINVSEAYQAGLGHLEMYQHAIGQAHGDVTQAARGYELFKYIARYARAVRAAGVESPQTTFFQNLGDYIYRANRGANAPGSENVNLGDQHADANRHANRGNTDQPFYVSDPQTAPTDAQINDMARQFNEYVNQTLPQMRNLAQTPVPGSSSSAPGSTAAGNEATRDQNNR